MNVAELAKKKHESWLKKLEQNYNKASTTNNSIKEGKKKKKKKKKKATKTKKNDENSDNENENDEESNTFLEKVENCLAALEEKYPQFSMNGVKNIWIVKPAGLSRGRGIATYNNLVEILDHVHSKETHWVIQKYIENPLLLKNRKVFLIYDFINN